MDDDDYAIAYEGRVSLGGLEDEEGEWESGMELGEMWGKGVPILAWRFMRRLATHSTTEAPELSMQLSIVWEGKRLS